MASTAFPRLTADAAQTIYNTKMSAMREVVEWSYKDVKQMWSSQYFKRMLKVGKARIGLFYTAAALLCNFKVFLGRGGQVASYFNSRAPTLERYLQEEQCGTDGRVVSVGGYLATVSGRTTCAPCKADWPSMASMLTSVAHRLSATVRPLTGFQRVDMRLHACGQLQCGLANQGLIFSLGLLYYFTLFSYVYNCAQ